MMSGLINDQFDAFVESFAVAMLAFVLMHGEKRTDHLSRNVVAQNVDPYSGVPRC